MEENTRTKITIMDTIWHERNACARHTGKCPDNVMLHPCNKESVEESAMQRLGYVMPDPKKARCFDMKVIWTSEIEEFDVICTYNGRGY